MKPDWYKFRPQTRRRKVYEPMTTREKRNVTFENQAEGLRVSDQSATIGGMLTTSARDAGTLNQKGSAFKSINKSENSQNTAPKSLSKQQAAHSHKGQKPPPLNMN